MFFITSSGELSVAKYSEIIVPKLSDFLLDLHQSLAHQGLAKSLDISIGMPALFVPPGRDCIKILAHFFAKKSLNLGVECHDIVDT